MGYGWSRASNLREWIHPGDGYSAAAYRALYCDTRVLHTDACDEGDLGYSAGTMLVKKQTQQEIVR